MAKDPVCGMQIEEKKAAGKAVHGDKTYFFCSGNCKKQFEQDPQKYLGEPRGACH